MLVMEHWYVLPLLLPCMSPVYLENPYLQDLKNLPLLWSVLHIGLLSWVPISHKHNKHDWQ